MNEFIQKNKKLLKFYYTALRLSGWMLLIFVICSSIVSIVVAKNSTPMIKEQILTMVPMSYFTLTFLALFGIGLAQLIRYLFDSNYKPGSILRHGDKFLYAYVVFTLIVATIHFIDFVQFLRMSDMEPQFIFLSNSITYFVYFVAKAIVLIGMAQFLRRLMPMIEESKSLV